MTRIQTLSDLQPGQSATVRSVCAPDGMPAAAARPRADRADARALSRPQPHGRPERLSHPRQRDRAAAVRLPCHPRGRDVKGVRAWD